MWMLNSAVLASPLFFTPTFFIIFKTLTPLTRSRVPCINHSLRREMIPLHLKHTHLQTFWLTFWISFWNYPAFTYEHSRGVTVHISRSSLCIAVLWSQFSSYLGVHRLRNLKLTLISSIFALWSRGYKTNCWYHFPNSPF